MSASPASPAQDDIGERRLVHTREVVCKGYARADGLYDIEGRMVDLTADGTGLVTIKNSSGSVVQTISGTFKSGAQTVQWDGTTSAGAKAPDGDYTITVDAKDLSGATVTAKTEIIGVVDGVDMSGTAPMLKIGEISVPINKVTRVIQAAK